MEFNKQSKGLDNEMKGQAEEQSLQAKAAKFNESINELSRSKSKGLDGFAKSDKSDSRILSRKNQVYDSESLDENGQNSATRLEFTFSEDSRFLFYWEHFISLLVFYSITVIPYLQVFDKEPAYLSFTQLLTFPF